MSLALWSEQERDYDISASVVRFSHIMLCHAVWFCPPTTNESYVCVCMLFVSQILWLCVGQSLLFACCHGVCAHHNVVGNHLSV